jgi:hypothetical protein
VRAQQHHVARSREDHSRCGGSPRSVDQREPHRPLEHTPVGGLESVDSHGVHAEFGEHGVRHPVVLAPGVDHDVMQLTPSLGVRERRGWLGIDI